MRHSRWIILPVKKTPYRVSQYSSTSPISPSTTVTSILRDSPNQWKFSPSNNFFAANSSSSVKWSRQVICFFFTLTKLCFNRRFQNSRTALAVAIPFGLQRPSIQVQLHQLLYASTHAHGTKRQLLPQPQTLQPIAIRTIPATIQIWTTLARPFNINWWVSSECQC